MTKTVPDETGPQNRGADLDGSLPAPIVALDPDEPAAGALKRIHRVLLDQICANDDGVRRRRDGEYLHDFRVAVRRSRTGLRQLKHLYPAAAVEKFSAEFAWLSGITNEARDLEVFLASFDALAPTMGDGVDALDPLVDFLRQRESHERVQCAEALGSGRYRAAVDEWADFLDRPGGPHALKGAADPRHAPAREAASRSIAKAYARVVRHGAGIHAAAPAADFHRLRLQCKKLRYLLEFFHPLFDAERGTEIVGKLRSIQDTLGAINDLAVQSRWIARAPAAAAAGADPLATHLEDRQAAERTRFVAGFSGLIAASQSDALRRFLETVPSR